MSKYTLSAVALAATLFAFGCKDKGDTGGDTAGADGADGTDGGDGADGGATDPEVAFSWGGSSVSFDVTGGPSATYLLGMAETAGSCGAECWTGEDCLNGYGTVGPYCHEITEGSTATLTYGGNPNNLAAGTTVFSDSLASAITYGMWSGDETMCWSWGDDVSYYSGEGCTTLSR